MTVTLEPSSSRTYATATDEIPSALRATLNRVAVGGNVGAAEFASALVQTAEVRGGARDIALATLMAAAMSRGPESATAHAVLEAALAFGRRPSVDTVSVSSGRVVLVAGSGKKGVRTLNVSTPAALVAAAAGAKVIKVGSSATSSSLGSRDLAAAIGIVERSTTSEVRRDLEEYGFAFVAVEPNIPAIDRMYGGRFHAPNLFSFGLAALASPVRGDVTLFGLSHPRVEVAARVLARFGMKDVNVISTRTPSSAYIDEIGLTGELLSCRARRGVVDQARARALHGSALPLPVARDADEAVARTQELLAGGGLPAHRALVARNASYVVSLSDPSVAPGEAYQRVQDVLSSGLAQPVMMGADLR